MATLKYGSQGSDVKELQNMLNRYGFKLDVDGIFGDKTEAAVREFREGEGLGIDGIVDDKVWDHMLSNAPKSSSNINTSKPFFYEGFTYDNYKESDSVTNAKNALDTMGAKPTYTSQWQEQLNDVIGKILNREKFSYDLNGDALYQQYKDKAIQQGKMAMGDAIGQASAMTGGYGNSYAQSVGQQMYQKELQNLNAIVPELYQMAYDKYNQEGQDLRNNYAMLGEQENRDYGKYRDSVGDWQNERDYLTNRYDSERNYDYSKYVNDRDFAYGKYADDKSYAYNEHRNAIADEQWQKEFEEAQRQFEQSQKMQAASLQLQREQAKKNSSVKTTYTPSPEPEPEPEPASYFETSLTDLKQMKAAGKSNKEAIDYLKDMLDEGLLTMSEYTSLYNKYRDNRLG